MIFYSVHYARQAGSGYIEPEHILEGLLLEDPMLFNLLLPEKPNLVKELKDELATWREKPMPQTEKRDLPLSPTAKAVVAAAGSEQVRLGHANIATQHLLLALLTACRSEPSWFRKATELRVQQLLSQHGITSQLTESKTCSGIVTTSSWVLDDRLIALNAQLAALGTLLIEKHIFTRAEFVALLDQNEGPLVPEAFLLPLIEALGKNGTLSSSERQSIETAAANTEALGEGLKNDEPHPPLP